MLKLIIADDETVICETIRSIIDWTSLNIQLLDVCKNGLETWNSIQKYQPDIVLTDIKMPGMSGLDLIAKAIKNEYIIEFIIMSGYADFSYAQTAIQYKVNNYLLKPCNEIQIKNAILNASQDIYRRKKINELVPDTILLQNNDTKNYKNYIRLTLDYIEEHFSDSTLSLKWICENVLFMNVDYISKEFFKQTGQKFTDYLTSLRIQKAKILLKIRPEDSITSIAEQTGYANNPQYFSQQFKQMTGMTPRNYTKQFQKEKHSQ